MILDLVHGDQVIVLLNLLCRFPLLLDLLLYLIDFTLYPVEVHLFNVLLHQLTIILITRYLKHVLLRVLVRNHQRVLLYQVVRQILFFVIQLHVLIREKNRFLLLLIRPLLNRVIRYVALRVLLHILRIYRVLLLVRHVVALIADILLAQFFLMHPLLLLLVSYARILLIYYTRPSLELPRLIFQRGAGRIFLQNLLRNTGERLVVLGHAGPLGVRGRTHHRVALPLQAVQVLLAELPAQVDRAVPSRGVRAPIH